MSARLISGMLGVVMFLWSATVAIAADLLVPDEYPTIQQAINASRDGDVILIADGVYTGPGNRIITSGGKAITLTSQSSDPLRCVIDCEYEARGFALFNDEAPNFIVDSLTVRRGHGGSGAHGGFSGAGGGVLCEDASPRFINCRFESCFAGLGAGVYALRGSPRFEGCTFIDNEANEWCEVLIAVVPCGAGAAGYFFQSAPEFVNCIFEDGRTNQSGAGLILQESSFSLTGCVFTAQSSQNSSAIAAGPFVDGTLTDCTFTGNTAHHSGGAIGLVGPADLSFDRCTFAGNVAEIGYAGAVNLGAGANVAFTSCVFQSNAAPVGGAVHVSQSEMSFINCLLAQNEADHGAAISISSNVAASFINNSVVLNVAGSGSGAIATLDAAVSISAIIANTVFAFNEPADLFAVEPDDLAVSYSILRTEWPGVGVLHETPTFVHTARGDFRLAPGSLGIDAGDNFALPDNVEVDLIGVPRFVDDPDVPDTGVGRPPIVDMGAYETQANDTTCAANLDGSGDVAFADLLILLATWGEVGVDADFDGGSVGFSDLLILLAAWGPCSR